MCKKTELLAPAGSFSTLKAVIDAGADAVYAAGCKFGARAYAPNFTTEEMLTAIDYVHLKGKRLYLTVNTLLKGHEIGELYDYLLPFYEAGLDAVIVQDMGVLHFVKKHFSDLPIHASTQMTVTGAYGAKLLLDYGCSRIVTARELSLAEIADIYKQTGAEIESFVHGALCYSYSGQCLLSSMIGGRSGNRGRCAQPCRLPYELPDSRKKAVSKKQKDIYPLSLKDLCTVQMIPELVESGIHAFKIEGRMKQAEYAAGVTGIYRKYLDLYEEDSGKPYQVRDEDYQKLLALGSRCGFTDGYYKRQNGSSMVTFRTPSHEKSIEGAAETKNIEDNSAENKEKIKGILRLFINNPAILMLEYKGIKVETEGDIVQTAKKQPLSRETLFLKMQKTGNTPFCFENLQIEMEENSFLPIGAINQLRRKGIEKLTELILNKFRRTPPADENMAHSMTVDIHPDNKRNCMVSPKNEAGSQLSRSLAHLSVLTETMEQFESVIEQPEAERIYLDSSILKREQLCTRLRYLVSLAHAKGKKCYLALPHIFRMETAHWYESHWKELADSRIDGCLVRNLEELSFLKNMGMPVSGIQGDYHLYVYSMEALKGWETLSLHQYTLPVELNAKELRRLGGSKGEMIIYGFQPVMLSAQCLHKNIIGCDGKEGTSYLKDRYGKLFPVRNHCDECYNILYNISPVALFHQFKEVQSLNPASVRLSFSVEDSREVALVFQYYRQALAGTLNKEHYLLDFTNGHFKRGVE